MEKKLVTPGISYLVLGGAKSGKSGHAQKLAELLPPPRLFIATAQALDDEMKKKIEIHKKQRGEGWQTIEEPLEISKIIKKNSKTFSVILLDCITLWITNLLLMKNLKQEDFEFHLKELTDAIIMAPSSVIVVSNEVGMGIVPESSLSRRFREFAGLANQHIARAVDKVVLCVAGFPLYLKE